MTQLCYALEDAAEKLGISETVLVRLSQFFKVPQEAYEDEGYFSFKGDLVFSESDILFFREVRAQLLEGATLETVKARHEESLRAQAEARRKTETQGGGTFGPVLARAAEDGEKSLLGQGGNKILGILDKATQALTTPLPYEQPLPNGHAEADLMEISHSAPLQKAAERGLSRYKRGVGGRHGQEVFKRLLKEITPEPSPIPETSDKFPGYKPLKEKVYGPSPSSPVPPVLFNAMDGLEGEASPAFHPEEFDEAPTGPTTSVAFNETATGHPDSTSAIMGGDLDWASLVAFSSLNTYGMNHRLRLAATRLRDQALKNPAPIRKSTPSP